MNRVLQIQPSKVFTNIYSKACKWGVGFYSYEFNSSTIKSNNSRMYLHQLALDVMAKHSSSNNNNTRKLQWTPLKKYFTLRKSSNSIGYDIHTAFIK
jgi:hypothetical protein